MNHNPNPFDFVPFDENGPQLKTLEEWMSYGLLRTGRITVQMKALTPVHIVGEQTMNGMNIDKSLFYQRNGKRYIPSSSIRGVLRAFIEAACNGWASQLTPYYPRTKHHNKHAYGFQVLENIELKKGEYIDIKEFSINPKYIKPDIPENGIDLASFLFGYIPGKPDKKDQFNPAWKGRITIDDAEVTESQLSSVQNGNSYKVPDLYNKPAFMGGPHPSASSWWYQFPKEIVKKSETDYRFIGSGFRGRKFYFHQNPVQCIGYYEESDSWNGLYYPKIQCINQNNSVTFDILFNNIPEHLLCVLLFALEPKWNIRHKIGYGKAYGYGSIEFNIQGLFFYEKGFDDYLETNNIDRFRQIIDEQFSVFDSENKNSIAHFIRREFIGQLAFILGYEDSLEQIFTYPCPGAGGFNVSQRGRERTTYSNELNNKINIALNLLKLEPDDNGVITITNDKSSLIAMYLREIKPTLDFEMYQEQSNFEQGIKEMRRFNYD